MEDIPRTLAEVIERERRELAHDVARLGPDWTIDDSQTNDGWNVTLSNAGLQVEQVNGPDELRALAEMHRRIRERQ